MAQAYQLPGEFRAPDMSAAAAAAGDQTGRDQEVMNNFLRQWNTATNIINANRDQSLREKRFQQDLIDSDRRFDLLNRQEDSIARGREQEYEVRKYGFEEAKRKDKELADSWGKRDEWQAQIARMLPNGGSDYNYKNGAAAIYRMAKTPADFVVLNTLLAPYEEQYATFRQTDQIQKEAAVQTGVEMGYIDIPDEEWSQLSVLRQTDPIRYMARLGKYQSQIDLKKEEAKRLKEREQAAAISGEMTARAIARGVPESQITETYEPGKGFGFKIEPPKPVKPTGTGGAGGVSATGEITPSGVSSFASAAKDLEDRALALDAPIEAAKSQVSTVTDPVEKEVANAKLRSLVEQQNIYRSSAKRNAELAGSFQAKEGEGTPSAPAKAPQAAPGLLGPIPGAPPKPSQMGVPTTSVAPSVPTPAETLKPKEPLYYVTEDGRSLTPDEGFLAKLRGERVIPVFEQGESPEEKKAREDFLASASEVIGTAPIPPNIASF